jgi:hypothetical protein
MQVIIGDQCRGADAQLSIGLAGVLGNIGTSQDFVGNTSRRFDKIPDLFRFHPMRPGEAMAEINAQVRDTSKVRDALWRMTDHMKRTGHRMLPI